MKIKLNIPRLETKDIISSLYVKYHYHKYLINNAYVFEWESDFFSLSEAEYIYEVEVKVDKRDYVDDFNKKEKHMLLESQDKINFTRVPNKFYYAFPKNMIASFKIPVYAGLIEVDPYTKIANVTKEAPFIHKEKIFDNYKNILLDKFYNRYRDYQLKEYALTEKLKEYENPENIK